MWDAAQSRISIRARSLAETFQLANKLLLQLKRERERAKWREKEIHTQMNNFGIFRWDIEVNNNDNNTNDDVEGLLKGVKDRRAESMEDVM